MSDVWCDERRLVLWYQPPRAIHIATTCGIVHAKVGLREPEREREREREPEPPVGLALRPRACSCSRSPAGVTPVLFRGPASAGAAPSTP